MPFIYRLQKVLDFRIRKKEEQLQVVHKAQEAVRQAEENLLKNREEIQMTKNGMRQADPMMYESYDKYLTHLWEKDAQLQEILEEKKQQLEIEKQKLIKLEQAVKVLEKHKERNREIYIEEEKKAELKQYSELGVVRFFRQTQERKETNKED